MSLSARRAWIEITLAACIVPSSLVALRKESVDRNIREDVSYSIIIKSLSARRAWIEICSISAPYEAPTKSLSARRAWIEMLLLFWSISR